MNIISIVGIIVGINVGRVSFSGLLLKLAELDSRGCCSYRGDAAEISVDKVIIWKRDS